VRSRQSTPIGQPGGGRRNGSNGRDAADSAPPRPLDEAARKEIAALPNVVEVNPEVRFTAEARREPISQLVMVSGMPLSSQSSGTLDGMSGHFFSGPDAEEAIVMGDMAKRLVDAGQLPASLLGKEITLRFAQRQTLPPLSVQNPSSAPNQEAGPDEEASGFSIVPSERKFLVVGVTPTSDSGGGQLGFNNAGMYLPLAVAEKLQVVQQGDLRDVARSAAAEGTRYAALNIRASSPTAVAQIESSVSHMGFATFSLIDVARNLRIFFAIFDMFLGIFGSLALAVASLGIVNTLVMAILERRREIGVLKALGASDRDVRRLFFAEAGVMGLVGGMFGVLLGWGIGRAIHLATTIYMKRQGMNPPNLWSVPWWLVLGAIAFAIVVSLASGIYPASRAARLDPVEALRYE
jgi:putative ABC transport system permease protein